MVEWAFTIAFTVEYVLRLMAVDRPARYATSFFGVVDLLAILPTYLALVVPDTHSLMVIRAIRLLRVFRVLKLAHFMGEAQMLMTALRAARRKITVFLGAILTVVLIVGALMYLIEGAPLLYIAAYFTPVRSLRENVGTISFLAVGLVITTALAVVARALIPGITWPVAIALGAIVAPPDAIAATAVAARLAVPRRIVTILGRRKLPDFPLCNKSFNQSYSGNDL